MQLRKLKCLDARLFNMFLEGVFKAIIPGVSFIYLASDWQWNPNSEITKIQLLASISVFTGVLSIRSIYRLIYSTISTKWTKWTFEWGNLAGKYLQDLHILGNSINYMTACEVALCSIPNVIFNQVGQVFFIIYWSVFPPQTVYYESSANTI